MNILFCCRFLLGPGDGDGVESAGSVFGMTSGLIRGMGFFLVSGGDGEDDDSSTTSVMGTFFRGLDRFIWFPTGSFFLRLEVRWVRGGEGLADESWIEERDRFVFLLGCDSWSNLSFFLAGTWTSSWATAVESLSGGEPSEVVFVAMSLMIGALLSLAGNLMSLSFWASRADDGVLEEVRAAQAVGVCGLGLLHAGILTAVTG